MELRRAKRYQVSAPAVFWWREPSGVLREGEGTTRDVSSLGLAILTTTAPALEARVQVEVRFRSVEITSKTAQLYGEGAVVRIERTKDAIKGFAAEVVFQARPRNQSEPFSLHDLT